MENNTTAIPKSPEILLSFINTKLRDFYPTLDELCQELEIDKQALTEQLAGIDYTYNPKLNRFV